MGLFDNLLGGVVKKNSVNKNVPVLGRHSEEIDDVIDDELPSVNRRKGRSKFTDMLGFATLLGGGLAMIYFINATPKQKVVEKPVVQEITNILPPLEPPAPPVPFETNAPVVQSQQIPLQNQSHQTNRPSQPGWLDRKMGGGLVVNTGGSAGTSEGKYQSTNRESPTESSTKPGVAGAPSGLASKLSTTSLQGVSAKMLPDRDYLITKGTALDCALETAIDSTVPGMTTCRLTRDVYSDNGHVVLLDRGSQLVGEYQGGMTTGQARIFVLWTRAKTPNGVIISLDSPGTDTLGRSGHAGFVDTHFMERFGASILMSLIKDSLAVARKNSSSSVNVGGSGSDQIALEMLNRSAGIPPTLYINQGDHLQIMVARDLDFSTVYGLELKE